MLRPLEVQSIGHKICEEARIKIIFDSCFSFLKIINSHHKKLSILDRKNELKKGGKYTSHWKWKG